MTKEHTCSNANSCLTTSQHSQVLHWPAITTVLPGSKCESTRHLLKTDALVQLPVPCVLPLPEFSQVLETDFSMQHTQNKAVPDQ